MITEDRLREIILKGIDTTKRVGSFILFKVLHIKTLLLLIPVFIASYCIVRYLFGDMRLAQKFGYLFLFYPIYVVYKNSVGFYRWLYQK